MTGLAKRSRPRVISFGFRVSGFELTRNSKLEIRNRFSIATNGRGDSVSYLCQLPKGRPGF